MGSYSVNGFFPNKILAGPSATLKGKSKSSSNFGSGDKAYLKPVAVCGVALRLPGGIISTENLWDALRNSQDLRCEVPESRYCREGFSDTLGSKGSIKTQHGYFLDQDLASFDSSLFSLTEEEAKRTDPQQRLLLEVVKECFENAGEIKYRGRNIGCYVGTFGEDWLQSQSKEDQHNGGYIMSGQIDLMLANRVSYENDLRGPSMVIKTGCSASLTALHEACRALQMNDCSGAIVAGTNLILGPTMTAGMTSEGILSPEGSCKTFDSKADGFARGEAITAIYLQLLDTAVQEHLPIRAVITNTGVNSDGRSQSLLHPSVEAQVALMRKVHGDIGSDPARTAFVECHGTGTPTGDPIEATAVGLVFGSKGVYIGSIKPNIGHSEGASGISSLLKSILMLEKGMIVPNIKFSSPNPKIDFDKYQLHVPKELTPWPRDRDLRVAINSFGIGGTNAHIIVEHPYTHLSAIPSLANIRFGSSQLLLMSANTPLSLQTLSERYKEYTKSHPNSLPNLAYTLARRREHHQYRTFAIFTEEAQYKLAPALKAPANVLGVTMIFSGQGAQWAQMGHKLLHDSTEFLKTIKTMDRVLQSLRYPPNWSIEGELKKPPETSRVNQAEISQPLCTALQIALFQVLTTGRVRPSAVVGHSSGEIAAAYASGAISMEKAIIVAYYRGFITRNQTLNGGMASIGLDSKTTSNFLKPGVVIACENSPSSTTISGDKDVLLSVVREIKNYHEAVLARPLKVDMAYHSHHMKFFSNRYLALVEDELKVRQNYPKNQLVPMFSSVWDQKIVSAEALSPEYWVANLVSPVRFHTAMANALREKADNLLLEIGPHSTLAGPLRQICSAMGVAWNYCPTLVRSSHNTHDMLTTFGTLYQHGIDIDWDVLITKGEVLTDLPVYPWDHSISHWYESRLAKAWRSRQFGHHELLGLRVPQTTDSDPIWRVVLQVEDVPWLTDHKVKSDIVLPFAAYASMAGEAFRQVTSIEEGYIIRDVTVATAMVIDEEKHLEIVTTLHTHYLAHADMNENWFDFTIASYTGSTWIQHCRGLIGPPQAIELVATTMENCPRRVVPKTWYGEMARLGLIYGPKFRRIESLTTSTQNMIAIGQVSNPSEFQSSHYPLHPATIDASFQVGLAALTKGLCRNFLEPQVPTFVESLEVSRGSATISCMASCSIMNGELSVDGVRTDGNPCLRLRGMKLTPVPDDSLVTEEDIYGAAHLEWVIDYDFQEVSSLVKIPAASKHEKQIIEELALLCIVESARLLQDMTPSRPHLSKYRAWLGWVGEEALTGKHPVLKNTAALVSLPAEAQRYRIEKLCKEASLSRLAAPFAEATMRIRNNIRGLFTGEVDTLELLLRENNLAQIYDVVSFDYSNFISAFSDQTPNLRILEIGAGTGGTTELILRVMQRSGRFPRYAKYTFSDISAGFFPKARERFAGVPNMEFKVFDVSQDPSKQGFEPDSYDLILAANVIHATPSLFQTLKNLYPLLLARGQLVLTEFCTSFRAPNYIYGNFSGWWLGEADDRKWEPYVNIARWDKELKFAGFGGVSDFVLDSEEPWQYCATIFAQKPPLAKDMNLTRKVSILCENPEADFNQILFEGLKQEGFNPYYVSLRHSQCVEGDFIASIDLEANFFENISEENFALFQNLLRNLYGRNLLWLMPPTQVNCVNPRGSQSLGMIRTARSELDLSITTLEIELVLPDFLKFVLGVFRKVLCEKDHGSLAPDREFAVHDNVVKVGRYRPFELHNNSMHNSTSPNAQDNSRQIIQSAKTPFCEEPSPLAIPAGSVEIGVRATGFGLKTSKFPQVNSLSNKNQLITREFSGIILRIGKDVETAKPGDRVFAMNYESCLAESVVLKAPLAVKIPDYLSFEDAATIPISFTTAFHALITIGQLKQGQTVLIHEAAASIGQAAIQICRAFGAKIYATCSNEIESTYLTKEFDISTDRLFNSRSSSFLSNFLRATRGSGANLVLSSLIGEPLQTSWKCVADFGKLIELGEHDRESLENLQVHKFLPNRSYICINIDLLIKKRPEQTGSTLGKCRDLFLQGKVQPFHPAIRIETTGDSSSFGKAPIAMPTDAPIQPSVLPVTPIYFDPDSTYMITGGLGGLGRAIAVWLAERGACNLLFLSPNAGLKPNDRFLFTELESMGCTTTAVRGIVQNESDVSKAIKIAKTPIKGVLHLAMQLRDALVLEMTYNDWSAVTAPKVDGTWNLHRQLGNSLDFFVMTSSLSTVFYQPGQSNYNAANTFMESFCQYRHNLGLPASVLNVCPIEGIGYVAENSDARRKLKSQGHWFLDERALLKFLELAILNSKPPEVHNSRDDGGRSWANNGHIVMGLLSEIPLEDPLNRATWRRDRRMGSYHNATSQKALQASSGWSELKEFLTRVTDQPDLVSEKLSKDFLAGEIGKKIFSFIMKPEEDIDVSLSLTQIGLDSLIAIELRRWWKQIFDLEISVLEIMNSGNITQLGEVAAQGLRKRFAESA